MRFSTITAAIAAIAVAVTAAPIHTNKAPSHSTASIDILNFALTLEHLEAAFYNEGYDRFDDKAFTDAGFDPKVRNRIGHIKDHENVHVTTITEVISSLGGHPVPACTYKFPVHNVHQFLAIAQALETTGVSAYTGALDGLDGELLTGAGTIVTVEARQSYFLNVVLGQIGFPYAFDTPLNPRQIITLATSFIQECPFDIGVTPYTHLNAELPAKGSSKVITSFAHEDDYSIEDTWCQFLYGNHLVISHRSECTLPPTAIGYVYVFVTSSKKPVNKPGSDILAGPALLFNGSHDH
ncbi:hypothetical protein BGZ98_008080 [Dissophora globulifera]|nr:hypothetical protein BGZ98_008080 [Dissophora globulifera]